MSGFKSQDENPHSFDVKLRGDEFQLTQDVSFYKDYAAASRENVAKQTKATSYKPLFIMPDIVAVDILVKYGIDVHSNEFMHDHEMKRKVLNIVRQEYPHLLMSDIKRI
jgi:hypothetical protein